MANLNKVMLIGRLTRDPETRSFANGGKVAKIGFAVNNRRKNQQTGQWEDEPVFIDAEAFNRGETGKQADLVEQNLRKGRQIFIEGHLRMDSWTQQDGQKRSKLVVVVDNFQYLDPKDGPSGSGDGGGYRSANAPRQQADSYPSNGGYGEPESERMEPPATAEADIPF
ncbi:MAG: single-stranded DNA-binding protein [Gemmataceae bacterium]